MTDLATQIGKLLGDDPVCGGRVCQGTVEAIAALVSPPSPEAVKGLVEAVRCAVALWFEGGRADQATLWDKETDSLMAAIAPALQSYAAEVERLREQRLKILAAVYAEAPRFVATICDTELDRSGKLLGEVRDLARAALTKGGDRG